VTVGSLSCEVSSVNSFSILESLNGQEFLFEDCEDDMTAGVTKFDLQKLQSPCCEPLDTNVTENDLLPLVSIVVNDYPNKKARLEKIVKRVSFDLPVLTEKDKEQCGEGNQTESTKQQVSLPVLGKAQRSIYTFMLSMRLEQQLERIQFNSNLYSKGSASKPITPREPFHVGPPPALKLFNTLDPKIVESIEALTGSVTHVSSGLLQSNKALFKETGAAGAKHLLATPNPAITKRALSAFLQQQAGFEKATFVVMDTHTTRRLFKDWKRVTVPYVGEVYAVYV
jgi:hypothetical protein